MGMVEDLTMEESSNLMYTIQESISKLIWLDNFCPRNFCVLYKYIVAHVLCDVFSVIKESVFKSIASAITIGYCFIQEPLLGIISEVCRVIQ